MALYLYLYCFIILLPFIRHPPLAFGIYVNELFCLLDLNGLAPNSDHAIQWYKYALPSIKEINSLGGMFLLVVWKLCFWSVQQSGTFTKRSFLSGLTYEVVCHGGLVVVVVVCVFVCGGGGGGGYFPIPVSLYVMHGKSGHNFANIILNVFSWMTILWFDSNFTEVGS